MESDQATILWSVQQTTERTSLSRSTLYRLMESGQLPYVKVGTRRLVPDSALRGLIQAHLVDGAE